MEGRHMAVEIYGTTIEEAQRFADEHGIAHEFVEHISDGIVWLFNDDVSDNLQLVVNDGKQSIYWDSADDGLPILQCGFDDIDKALRAYNALLQGYER